MTDKEIIKALECLTGESIPCRDCSYSANYTHFDCQRQVAKDALDLINCQKAEIERLKGYPYAIQVEVSKKLESQIKSKAAKECLAKVKNYIKTHCNPYGKPDFEYDTSIKILNFIDNLVKEMVGEENDR